MIEHHRRSIRLKDFDYAGHGAYFITTVTHERRPLFGRVVRNDVELGPLGELVRDEWLRTADLRSYVRLDQFVIMPNHIHGIVFIEEPNAHASASAFGSMQGGSVGAIVRAFKSASTRRIREQLDQPELVVWQRNYFERVVRSESHLNVVRQYVIDNPIKWAIDRENPDRGSDSE
jgi:REP element-mobilizing transposase RayT